MNNNSCELTPHLKLANGTIVDDPRWAELTQIITVAGGNQTPSSIRDKVKNLYAKLRSKENSIDPNNITSFYPETYYDDKGMILRIPTLAAYATQINDLIVDETDITDPNVPHITKQEIVTYLNERYKSLLDPTEPNSLNSLTPNTINSLEHIYKINTQDPWCSILTYKCISTAQGFRIVDAGDKQNENDNVRNLTFGRNIAVKILNLIAEHKNSSSGLSNAINIRADNFDSEIGNVLKLNGAYGSTLVNRVLSFVDGLTVLFQRFTKRESIMNVNAAIVATHILKQNQPDAYNEAFKLLDKRVPVDIGGETIDIPLWLKIVNRNVIERDLPRLELEERKRVLANDESYGNETTRTFAFALLLNKYGKGAVRKTSDIPNDLHNYILDKIKISDTSPLTSIFTAFQNKGKLTLNNIKDAFKTEDLSNEYLVRNPSVLSDYAGIESLHIGLSSEVIKYQTVLNNIANSTSLLRTLFFKLKPTHKTEMSDTHSPKHSSFKDSMTGLTAYERMLRIRAKDTQKADLQTTIENSIEKIRLCVDEISDILIGIQNPANNPDFTLSANVSCGKLMLARQYLDYINNVYQELHKLQQFEAAAHMLDAAVNTQANIQKINAINSDINDLHQIIDETLLQIVKNELVTLFPTQQFTLPDGSKGGIKELLDYDKEVGFKDVSGFSRWLDSAAQCSSPLIALADAIKKKSTGEAMQQTRKQEERIADMTNTYIKETEAENKDSKYKTRDSRYTGWMYESTINSDNVEVPTGKFVMDFDLNAFNTARAKAYTRIKIMYKGKRQLIAEAMRNWILENTELRPDLCNDLNAAYYPSRKNFPNATYNAFTPAQKKYWANFMSIRKDIIEPYQSDGHIEIWDGIFIRKDRRERLKSTKFKDIIKFVKKEIRNQWLEENSDDLSSVPTELHDFTDHVVYTLPLYYNYLLPGETMEDVSLDASSNLQRYAQITNNTTNLINRVNILDGLAAVIKNQKVEASNKSDRTRRVIKTTSGDNTSMFNPKALEDRNDVKMYADWMRAQVYGKTTKPMHKLIRTLINKVMKFVAIDTLGFNLKASVANVVQGFYNIGIDAASGQFFNRKNVLKAIFIYFTNIPGMIADIGSTNPQNKLTLMNRLFNVQQDFEQDIHNSNYDRTRVGRLFTSDAFFAFMHAGEHFLQTVCMLAYFDNKKHHLTIKNADGSTSKVNIWDAFELKNLNPKDKSKRGAKTLVLKPNLTANIRGVETLIIPRGANIPPDENSMTEADFVTYVTQQIAGVNEYMHGIYNQEDKNNAQYNVLVLAVMMYRKYIVPSWNRRFAKRSYNSQLDTDVEGYYKSWWDYISKLNKAAFGKQFWSNWEELTEEQKNLIKDSALADTSDTFNDIKQGLQTDDTNALNELIQRWNNASASVRRNWITDTKNMNITKAIKISLDEVSQFNLSRARSEILTYYSLYISYILFSLLSGAIQGDDDDDDDDLGFFEKLVGNTALGLKYFTRREITEATQFMPLSILNIPAHLLTMYTDPLQLQQYKLFTMGNTMPVTYIQLINSPVIGWDVTYMTNKLAILGIFTDSAKEEVERGLYKGYPVWYKTLMKSFAPMERLFGVDATGQQRKFVFNPFQQFSESSFENAEKWYSNVVSLEQFQKKLEK